MSEVNQQIANINANLSNLNSNINNIVNELSNKQDKPVMSKKVFNANSKANVAKFLNTFGIGAPNGHKGMYACYGNAFTGEEEFVGVGEVAKGDTDWNNGNVLQAWASQSKILTTITLAKMLEEGLVNIEDPISKYIPDCSGNAYYITGLQTVADATNPNIVTNKPLTWKPTYGTFD